MSLPKHWVTKTIGEVCETSAGGTPLKTNKEYHENGTIPWLLSGEVCEKYITQAKNKITELGMRNSSAKLFPYNSVLVAMYGATAGQVGILHFESTTNQAVCAILPNKDLIAEYIYYYLLLYKPKLVAQAVGGAQPNVSQEKIKKIPIPLPPLDEQKAIVAKLDSACEHLDNALESCQQALKLADELWSASLDKALAMREGWATKTLGDETICIIERGSSPRPIKNFITTDEDGVNWIKIGDTTLNEKYVTTTAQKITPKGAEKSRYVYEGDFILSNSMSFGRPYIVKTTGCVHDGWFIVRLTKSINQDWFYYMLCSPVVQDQINILAHGSTVQNISSDLVKKVEIPLPPLDEQKAIVAKLDQINEVVQKLKSDYTQKIISIKELKASLLNDAFSGKLTNKE